MKILLSLIFSILLYSPAWAGREGNGGGGVKFNGHLYLLDLFEVDAFEPHVIYNPKASDPILGRPRLQSTMERTLAVDMKALRSKLVELGEINPRFALSLIHHLEQIRWYSSPNPLTLSSDYYFLWEYLTPILGKVRLDEVFVQLAMRYKNRVILAPAAKRDLNSLHYLALIFHEGVSYMYFNLLSHCGVDDPTSETIRRVVALLFSKRDEHKTAEMTRLTDRMLAGDCLLIAENLRRYFNDEDYRFEE